MRVFWERLKAFCSWSKPDREFDAEICFHLEEQAEEYVRQGMTHEQAFLAARRDFGGVTQIRESHREMRGFPLLASIFMDLRFALRMLARDRGFTAATLLTLTLAIGAGTAMFSVMRAVLLRPLPLAHADRLMAVSSTSLKTGDAFFSAAGVYLDWRDEAKSFEHLGAVSPSSATLAEAGEPRRVSVMKATPEFLLALGVRPLAGRLFSSAASDADAVLVDEGFWRNKWGRKDIVGARVVLDDKVYTVAGVVPDLRFSRYPSTDVWTRFDPSRAHRGGGGAICVGLLRPGVSREAAQAELDAITQQIRARHREDSEHGVLVQPLRESIVQDSRRPLLLLTAAVLLVLMIGCANVADLLLAKASAREHEMFIRAGLGAGRLRLLRQILVESLLLASLGGLAGTALAAALVQLASTLGPRLARSHELAPDPVMLWIAAGLTLGTGLVFGIAPAWHAARPASASRWGNRVRGALVVAQLSLAMLLLSASGLVTNSLVRLLRLDLGFDRSGLAAISVDLPYKRSDRAATGEFVRRLSEDLTRLPGVLSVAVSDYPPLQAVLFPILLQSETKEIEAFARHVSPAYFETLRTPILSGHDFTGEDLTRKPVPVLINAAAARALFGSDSPLGKPIRSPLYKDRREMEVIGVAGAARQLWLRDEPGYQIYFPTAYGHAGHILIRVAPNAGPLAGSVRAFAAALDAGVPPPTVSSLDEFYSRETAQPRLLVALFGSLATLGLVLAVIGIYGVMTYAVVRRTREFGVRMALGADSNEILRLVAGSGARLTIAGVVIGVAASLALTRFLRALLYGVEPGDPLTLGGVALLLTGTALLACWVAARRAARIDACTALRCE